MNRIGLVEEVDRINPQNPTIPIQSFGDDSLKTDELFADLFDINLIIRYRSGNGYFIANKLRNFFSIGDGVNFISYNKNRSITVFNAFLSTGCMVGTVTFGAAMRITDISSPGAFVGGIYKN